MVHEGATLSLGSFSCEKYIRISQHDDFELTIFVLIIPLLLLLVRKLIFEAFQLFCILLHLTKQAHRTCCCRA